MCTIACDCLLVVVDVSVWGLLAILSFLWRLSVSADDTNFLTCTKSVLTDFWRGNRFLFFLPFISKLQTPTQLLLKSSDVVLGIDSAAAPLHPHAQLADRVNTRREIKEVERGSFFKVTFYQILKWLKKRALLPTAFGPGFLSHYSLEKRKNLGTLELDV